MKIHLFTISILLVAVIGAGEERFGKAAFNMRRSARSTPRAGQREELRCVGGRGAAGDEEARHGAQDRGSCRGGLFEGEPFILEFEDGGGGRMKDAPSTATTAPICWGSLTRRRRRWQTRCRTAAAARAADDWRIRLARWRDCPREDRLCDRGIQRRQVRGRCGGFPGRVEVLKSAL